MSRIDDKIECPTCGAIVPQYKLGQHMNSVRCHSRAHHSIARNSVVTKESLVQQDIANRLFGEREVRCRFGSIDVLVDKPDLRAVIEVKAHHLWKDALMQVLLYGLDYPEYNKMIVLFNSLPPTDTQKGFIEGTCAEFDVDVYWLQYE